MIFSFLVFEWNLMVFFLQIGGSCLEKGVQVEIFLAKAMFMGCFWPEPIGWEIRQDMSLVSMRQGINLDKPTAATPADGTLGL